VPKSPSEAVEHHGWRALLPPVGLGLGVLVVGFVAVGTHLGATKETAPNTPAEASFDGSAPPPPLHKYAVPMHTLPPPRALAPGAIRVLVLGDSLAQFLGTTLRHVQDDSQIFVAERGVGSCNIFAPTPEEVDGGWEDNSSCSEDWAADVAQLRPDVTLVVMGGAFFTERACQPAFRAEYTSRLSFLTDAMGERAGTVALALVPYPIGRWRYADVPKRVDCLNSILGDFARARRLPTIDLMKHVCPTSECRTVSEGAPIRPDGLHFDGPGAHETARHTLAELVRISGRVVQDASTRDRAQ
jgi:hypothetical protein